METITQTKVCRKCGVSKARSEFGKRANPQHGLRATCKECRVRGPSRPTCAERLWAKVDKSGPVDPRTATRCWVWTGTTVRGGYGKIRKSGKNGYAHRLAYEIAHGSIPAGLCVLHRCDNPPCCNPAHLSLGTDLDNSADCRAKGRDARGERVAGAKLTRAKADAIRSRFAAGGTRALDLAAEFAVGRTTIYNVVRGATWR
jgi:hypothetical protein